VLTDVFFRRYESRRLFDNVGERETGFFVQAYRIVNEQMWPFYGSDQKVDAQAKKVWISLHDRLSMELGVTELAPRWWTSQTEWMGKPHSNFIEYDINLVVQQWLTTKFVPGTLDSDAFIKRRLSFVELAFRTREEELSRLNDDFPKRLAQAELNDKRLKKLLGASFASGLRIQTETINATFQSNVTELNERFKYAAMPLHYHNGYIQIIGDQLVQRNVEQPFWDLVKDAKWKNVSIDMATAIDLRDTGGRDPSFYAAKALESTAKIISDDKGWTKGTEKGVGGYLSNLTSKANGGFIGTWENESMQRFFSDVRNDLGHGPGSEDMPQLSASQIDQTIEFCMSWIKSLIKRL